MHARAPDAAGRLWPAGGGCRTIPGGCLHPAQSGRDRRRGPLDPFLPGDGEEFPDKSVQVKREIAEGPYVVLHCHPVWPEPDWTGSCIFRFDEDVKNVEHWDVLLVSTGSAHGNTTC